MNRQVAHHGLDSAGAEEGVDAFESFVMGVEPRLRRSLVALYGSERGRDATAEALAYAWEHWERVQMMENPVGYLFRVGQSRTRRRRVPVLFEIPKTAEIHVEPLLAPALQSLSSNQRLAVVLVHGFGWQASEVAEVIGIKATTVQNHLERGLRRLRRSLGADQHER